MSSRDRFVAGALVCVCAIALAVGCRREPAGGPSDELAEERAAPISVTVAEARIQPVERTIRFVGTLHADARAEVATEVDGRLLSLGADLGDAVEAGQTLATIDPSAREAKLREAEAVLVRAASEERRAQMLREKGIMSQQEFDELSSASSVARARREVLAIEVAHTLIRAPFPGRIAERLADVGSYVRVGTPLFVLVSDRPLRLRGEVPERFAAELEIGQQIRGSVSAFPGEEVRGTLTRISAAVNPTSRALTVEAEVPNDRGQLRPGFFCEAEILVRSDAEAVVVPVEAVVDFAGVTRVFVVDESGAARSREIATGIRLGPVVEVASGLQAGERVATSALGRLVDGAPVKGRLTAERRAESRS
jgi:membrane fusion protein (multidrug efflux system)